MDIFQSLTQREKVLLGILGIAVLISGCVFLSPILFAEKAVSTQVLIPPPASAKQAGKAESSAKAEMTLANIKNPFQVPPQYQVRKETASDIISGNASAGAILPRPDANRPVLSGIITGGAAKMAIIEQGGTSDTLGMGDTIGAYTVTSISDTQVVLNGPEGRMVLNIGR